MSDFIKKLKTGDINGYMAIKKNSDHTQLDLSCIIYRKLSNTEIAIFVWSDKNLAHEFVKTLPTEHKVISITSDDVKYLYNRLVSEGLDVKLEVNCPDTIK
ncbi:MAG TPA: hypothetical protein ENJ28_03000 [Gammaproteobacteria bacterium]|nr:hypothetical protein [Gammaproteobacteria bacterium]